MSKKEALPKMGDKIPIEKFHISKFNVRYDEPFGNSEEDQKLIYQITTGKKLVAAFKARPERKGYGVYVGRRRFLAKKATGATSFVVGKDVLIQEISEEEALDESLIENISFLKKNMDPVTRAKRINERISAEPGGIRAYARKTGISPQTLSEWLKVLKLTPKMQKTVSKGLLFYTDALKVARMDLGKEVQNDLAETLEGEGLEAFQKEVERRSEKKMKRGIPKGKYEILRITFDKVYPPDMKIHKKLAMLAEAKRQKLDEYAKWVLEEHAKTAA